MDSLINFQSIFHALPNAYLVVDPELTIRDANRACLRNFDIAKEDMIGRRLHELLPQSNDDADGDKLKNSYAEVLANKVTVALPLLMYANGGHNADGQLTEDRYWSITHVPVLDDGGNVRWIVTHADEIAGEALSLRKESTTSTAGQFAPASQARNVAPAWIKPSRDAAGSLATHSSSLNVLLVEDNEDLKETTATVIEALGHRVVAVDNAERALELLATESFDVLFTDLSLPKTTGAELAREALNRYPSMRVIITSGYGRAMANARNLDAVFLPKPYQLVDIQSALDGTTLPNY